MIEYASGSIFDADVDALVNPCNCVGAAGRGLSLEFKRRFRRNFREYHFACQSGEVKLGAVFVTCGNMTRGGLLRQFLIFNFPTKDHWRDSSCLEDIASGLTSLVAEVKGYEVRSIAIPALGCGLGGLLWDDVRPMIEAAAREMPSVRVVVFPPQ